MMLGRGSQSCIRTGNKAGQFPRRAAAKRIEFLLSTFFCNFMFVSSCRPFVLLPTKPFVRLLRNCPLSHPTRRNEHEITRDRAQEKFDALRGRSPGKLASFI